MLTDIGSYFLRLGQTLTTITQEKPETNKHFKFYYYPQPLCTTTTSLFLLDVWLSLICANDEKTDKIANYVAEAEHEKTPQGALRLKKFWVSVFRERAVVAHLWLFRWSIEVLDWLPRRIPPRLSSCRRGWSWGRRWSRWQASKQRKFSLKISKFKFFKVFFLLHHPNEVFS